MIASITKKNTDLLCFWSHHVSANIKFIVTYKRNNRSLIWRGAGTSKSSDQCNLLTYAYLPRGSQVEHIEITTCKSK